VRHRQCRVGAGDGQEGDRGTGPAARTTFRYLKLLHRHDCLFAGVWRDNRRRWTETVPVPHLLHRDGPGWRAMCVGDAAKSPDTISHRGGAREYRNVETGAAGPGCLLRQWPTHRCISLLPRGQGAMSRSMGVVDALPTPDRMVPLFPDGLTAAMQVLSRQGAVPVGWPPGLCPGPRDI